jgi:serine/threonine-protein kinase
MVHRDFKPANLFVSQRLDGTSCIKVLDFGIAKVAEAPGESVDQKLTGTAAVMGSPRYMAPEQMRSMRDVDARADIWAVGTTLYELLTGTGPFHGESLPAICASILQDEPAPMHRLRPEIPAALDAVVARCIAKRPDDRWPDVGELAAALAPFGSGPASFELAGSVARVRAASRPSFVISSTSPNVGKAPPAGGVEPMSSVEMTGTAWTADDLRRSRFRARTIAVVFASFAFVGLVLGAAALLRAPSHRSAAATPPPTPSATSPTPPAATVTATPTPTPAVATAATASASTPEPTSTDAAPADKLVVKPAARPNAVPAKPPSGRPSSTAPRTQSLWDDRK